MPRLFRSKSFTFARPLAATPYSMDDSFPQTPSPFFYGDEEEEEEGDECDDAGDEGYFGDYTTNGDDNPVTTPFISPDGCRTVWAKPHRYGQKAHKGGQQQFSMLAAVVAALRKSLVTCSVERDDVASDVEIGFPTEVRHVSHVTFDRFNGFLGLPADIQPDFPRKPPSASAGVFGVSAQSMQCSYDHRGNSVPAILLRIQDRLYSEGGLQAEGIFRINAENGQEEDVRNQLSRGFLPHGIDVHCLAGLIKAWFRELPSGVLDSLTPEQVMQCNTEEDCTELVELLPPTEAALLDWAINLMADIVQHENQNKMNARNIAMVFAPNMKQMADPLTALIHAVQVMNFLKMLIVKTLREREESAATDGTYASCADRAGNDRDANLVSKRGGLVSNKQDFDDCSHEGGVPADLLRNSTFEGLEADKDEEFWSCKSKNDVGDKYNDNSGRMSRVMRKRCTLESSFKDEYENGEVEGIINRLSLRKGMRKLCRHPVFQLSKPVKKSDDDLGVVNNRGGR